MRFYGTYYHNLDAKGRLVVPATFRERIKELKKLYILQGFDGAISIYPEEAYSKEIKFLESLSFKDAKTRAYVRTMYASIEELDVDAAGRVTLNVRILKKYGISQSVTVIGVGDHLEVWDSAKYETYEASAVSNLETFAEDLVGGRDD